MNLATRFDLIIFILTIIANITISQVEYRYKLDVGNPNDYCPKQGYVCSDGKPHYFCTKTNESSGRTRGCRCYKPKSITPGLQRIFVQGTNGIRNKVAGTFGISNMNLVYWSDALGALADKFLEECVLGEDPCKIVGDKQILVTQNSVYTDGRLIESWPGRIVRHWYKEIGYDVHTWNEFKTKFLNGEVGNFSNMIFPITEFIGCGAARMYHGFFIVCFYHPPFKGEKFPENYKFGKACSNCSSQRTVCSKTFSGLCGVDFDFGAASSLQLNNFLWWLIVYIAVVPSFD